ncbi:putative RING-H2 finger protein ATL49 [Drosera capensis]
MKSVVLHFKLLRESSPPLHEPHNWVISPSPPLKQATMAASHSQLGLDSRISPSILLIIVILAIIFFVSGLLHLLVRFLLRPPQRDTDELEDVTVMQGQLQQLFHLHDAGVDQSFIHTLPVFLYKAIIGDLKDPFDCAVCLCEFEPEDKMRLLPKCCHAFHMECIDTWLLAHSTCPLCRASLIPDFEYPNHGCSQPVVFVLESGSGVSSRRRDNDRDRETTANSLDSTVSSVVLGSNPVTTELGSTRFEFSRKSCEICEKNDNVVANQPDQITTNSTNQGEKIVQVKLGKFKSVDGAGEGSSEANCNVDSRRCYSMGSFAYVMDEASSLQVPMRTSSSKKLHSSKKPSKGTYRAAVSEYGSDSSRNFNSIEAFRSIELNNTTNSITKTKEESFSISRIWLRGNKRDNAGSSRAVSFRLSGRAGDIGASQRTISEIGIDENVEMGFDHEEKQSCYSVDSQVMAPCSASNNRRTLLWLMDPLSSLWPAVLIFVGDIAQVIDRDHASISVSNGSEGLLRKIKESRTPETFIDYFHCHGVTSARFQSPE